MSTEWHAADRIKALETALQEIAELCGPSDCPEGALLTIDRIARFALGPKYYRVTEVGKGMTEKVEWTSPIIARLKELLAHNDSLSYSFIANQMMKDFPGFKFTRNGISGKVWRMKLPPREKVVVKADGSQPRKPYIKPPKRLRPDAFRTRCRKEFKFLELRTGQCKWPAGTGPYTFCGKPIVSEGAPYCARHSNLAYVKPKKVFA